VALFFLTRRVTACHLFREVLERVAQYYREHETALREQKRGARTRIR